MNHKLNTSITARFKLDYGAFQLAVNLSLPNSGITVLYGHSGSGKTTLLRCIAGLQQAQEGYLEINGSVWQDSDVGVFLPTHKRPLGYVFQEANLFSHLTVRENLNFGLKRKANPPNPPSKRGAFFSPLGKGGGGDFNHIVTLLGIEHLLDRMPERLSGGEKQRVGIARALVLNPEILLMDEPLASLDSKRKQEILPFLSRLNQELNIPVLYVTHSHQEVAQLADYLVLMDGGKVQAAGKLSETLSRLDLPLSQERDATTVWNAAVVEHDIEFHLTRVSFEGGSLYLPAIDAKIGTSLRVQIYARDVSLVLEVPRATSVLNILPAQIVELSDGERGQTIVRLEVGNQPLLAHITQKSAVVLNLKIGKAVFVQIKGMSILN